MVMLLHMMIKPFLIVNHCNFEGGCMKYVFEEVIDERTTFGDCNFLCDDA
jgi:hypothetical protein